LGVSIEASAPRSTEVVELGSPALSSETRRPGDRCVRVGASNSERQPVMSDFTGFGGKSWRCAGLSGPVLNQSHRGRSRARRSPPTVRTSGRSSPRSAPGSGAGAWSDKPRC